MSHFLDSLHPDDVPPHCQGEPVIDEEPEPEEPSEPQPDYDYVKHEDTASYRDSLRDAGRGHLVRW